MKKILASPSSIGQISTTPLDLLKNAGYEVVVNPYGRKLTDSEVIDLGKDCVGIVAGVENLDSSVIKKLPKLKCISRVGVGMDNIDIPFAESQGIKIHNTPNGPTRAVAELTLGLTLSLLRKIPLAHYNIKNGIWKKETGSLLLEKKVGIIGLGRIGRLTAELFRSLGNPVCGFDIFPDQNWANKNDIELLNLESLLKCSDIITIHVPGVAHGKPIITDEEIKLLKTGALVINVSRGGVVDEHALHLALKSGKISGAALDVFEKEPYEGDFQLLDNVILTPHIGSYAKEGKLQMEIDAVKNLIKSLSNLS